MLKIKTKRRLKEFPETKLPKFAHADDACADISSAETRWIGPGQIITLDTGLNFDVPTGWEIQMRSRSGLAAKAGIHVLNSPGTIDAGYVGPIKVILFNASENRFLVNAGDRIAQLAVREVPPVEFSESEEINENTERGTGGLGSTGVA